MLLNPLVTHLLAVLIGLGLAGPAMAAGPLAVDVVTLKSGRSLRGAVVTHDPHGPLTMAVSRAWLKSADAKEFARQTELHQEEQHAAWSEAVARIESLLEDPPQAKSYVFFLKQELQRLRKLLEAKTPVEPEFFLLEIPGSRIAKSVIAPPDRRRLACFAWDAGFNHVETRSAAELHKDLVKADIALDGPAPDLSSKLPARRQSAAEWSARLAVVEYALDDPLDFQGMGETLVRTGDGEPIDLAAVLPKLLSAQVDSLLGDLLEPGLKPRAKPAGDPAAWHSAIAVAEKEHRTGFRVTRLEMDAERLTVSVQTDFVIQTNGGAWQSIWKCAESADGRQPRPADEARITEDPQVKSALKSLGGLGLGGEAAVNQAVRVGAATMSAQHACDARFLEFRDRYCRRLDGPPLPLPMK